MQTNRLRSFIKIGEESDVLNIKSSKEGYNKVKEFYELWKNKEALKINQWQFLRRDNLPTLKFYEALAIMDRANELVTEDINCAILRF